jgi:putative sterol carrier protein
MRMPTKDEIKQFYTQALQRCLDAFRQLDDKEWSKKASDEWTAREHLGHLVITHEVETMPLTRQALAGEPANVPGFASREDMVPFRNQTLEQVKDVPVPDLLRRLEETFGEHIRMLDGLSEADLEKPIKSPAWDRPGTLRDLFFASYLFLPSQYQEIRRVAKKKLPHWIEASNTEQVNYHLNRIFHYMPLIYNPKVGGDMVATYQFTMEGEGGGQWSIRIDNGRAESSDGPADSFDAEVKTRPELWMDLSQGDLNPVWAITTRKVQLGGNPALAMKLGSLFSARE